MTGFIGSFADLTGFTVGNFKVEELAGRDRNKAPLWRVICQQCHCDQVFNHARLTSALETKTAEQVLHCQNAACIRSRSSVVRTETLSDVRRAEREQQERTELEAQRQRELAAREAGKQADIRAEQQTWIRFANAQIKAGVAVEDLMTFESWQRQSDHWREEILRKTGIN